MKVRSKDIIFSIKATVELLVVTQPVTPLYRKRVDIIGSTGVLEKKNRIFAYHTSSAEGHKNMHQFLYMPDYPYTI